MIGLGKLLIKTLVQRLGREVSFLMHYGKLLFQNGLTGKLCSDKTTSKRDDHLYKFEDSWFCNAIRVQKVLKTHFQHHKNL